MLIRLIESDAQLSIPLASIHRGTLYPDSESRLSTTLLATVITVPYLKFLRLIGLGATNRESVKGQRGRQGYAGASLGSTEAT